jgi:hypothetical protein
VASRPRPWDLKFSKSGSVLKSYPSTVATITDRFMPFLKTDNVPIFESLPTPGKGARTGTVSQVKPTLLLIKF